MMTRFKSANLIITDHLMSQDNDRFWQEALSIYFVYVICEKEMAMLTSKSIIILARLYRVASVETKSMMISQKSNDSFFMVTCINSNNHIQIICIYVYTCIILFVDNILHLNNIVVF